MGLLVILLVAMADFLIGAFIGPQNDVDFSRGWIGLNGTCLLFQKNKDYSVKFSPFFSVKVK